MTVALRMARPLAIQKGPVVPLIELDPPKSVQEFELRYRVSSQTPTRND